MELLGALLVFGVITILPTSASIDAMSPAPRVETWTKYPGNPVLSPGPPGSWDQDLVTQASVLYRAGLYRMWYAGCGNRCEIGYATSPDGITWTKYAGNPVLSPGPAGWEPTSTNPTVVHDGTVYRMWYVGNDGRTVRIGYATSPDGITWTKYAGNPVLVGTTGQWDRAAVSAPKVIREAASFTMYYSGHGGDFRYEIGRATSADGVGWAKDPANPLMSPTEPWEAVGGSARIHPSHVLASAHGYEMYYTGSLVSSQIGHATSPDGVAWTRDPTTPVIPLGTPGEWDDAGVAGVGLVELGTHLRLWYSGFDGTTWRIGLAEAPVREPPPCPLSHGYWKNHEEAWPVSSLDLGATTFSQDELLALLRSPSRGDASVILARQLIAAKLNVAHGSDPLPVQDAVADADTLLSSYAGRLPLAVNPSSSDGQVMVGLSKVPDDYNNGLLSPGCEPHNSDVGGDVPAIGGPGLPRPTLEAEPPRVCACGHGHPRIFPA